MAPCLRRNSTGELVETTFKKISPTKASCADWEFDWTKPERNGYDVYALYVKGKRTIQGMIAMKDDPDNLAVNVDIVEAAPNNNPHNSVNKSHSKEYTGVGGHLFAEACRHSLEKGFDGFVFLPQNPILSNITKKLSARD